MTIEYTRALPDIEALRCTSGFEFEPHVHDSYVVWLNPGCCENFCINGSSYLLETGATGIFEPGIVHSNFPCIKESSDLRSFYIAPEFFYEIMEKNSLQKKEAFFKSRLIKDKELNLKLLFLHDALFQKNYDFELDEYMEETFMLFFKRHSINSLKELNKTCDKRVRLVMDYFNSCFNENIRLESAASVAGCSKYHLIRLFKNQLGISPHSYLVQVRLENARYLISKGFSIAGAAIDSGFSDQSHLTRKFKLRYGITPYSYSKQCQFCSR